MFNLTWIPKHELHKLTYALLMKVGGAYVTPIVEFYTKRFVVKIGQQNDECSFRIELCAQKYNYYYRFNGEHDQ